MSLVVIAATAHAQYALQYGTAVDIEGTEVFVGEGRNLLLPGSVYVYDVSPDGRWKESAVLAGWDVASGEADGFGRALAVSGNTAFVGAPSINRVFVFQKSDDGAWSRQQILAGESEGFGSSVAVDGSTGVVGAPGGRESTGSAVVFVMTEDGWVLEATLSASEDEAGSGFGGTVAVHGDAVIVGAPSAASRAGIAHAFNRSGTQWEAQGTIQMPGSDSNDQFGLAIALGDGEVAIGAPGRDRQSGSVGVFERDDATGEWDFAFSLEAPVTVGGEQFGASVALTPSGYIVGAPGFNEREGRAFRFERDAMSTDVGLSSVAASGLQFRSSFGGAVAAGDGIVAVGAAGHDNFEGAVFPFVGRDDQLAQGDVMINNSGDFASVTGGIVECSDGSAEDFNCSEVDMLSFLSRDDIGARRGIQVNDVWGWEDPLTNREYAIVGRTDGTSFVDLTDPYNPVFVGDLPKTDGSNQSIWRDMKVYKDHAFIVSDGAGPHHMQVFDLTQLRDVTSPPATFEPTALYKGIYSSHNIVINEDTGFAFAVGSGSGGESCGGALHMINIQDPRNPTFAGCFADPRTGRGTGATHDAQCVMYSGPDSDYSGREICLSSNGTALSIADVTDKENPKAISIAEYPNVAYTHQGWLTDDHRYFYLNDEGDEASGLVEGTRTMIFDLQDLDDPVVAGQYVADHSSIDHNLYVKGNLMYQTNYSAGLRILDISNPEAPVEVGYFDTVPYGKNDNSPVLGAWSNYPFFESGVIVVTSGREGVFFLKKRSVDI
jgi:choice-of-anchor B domain-containing protein